MPKKTSQPASSQPQPVSPVLVGLLILSLIVTIVGGGYLLLSGGETGQTQFLPSSQPSKEQAVEQAPTETDQAPLPSEEPLPIASGPQTYFISGQQAGPRITQAVIDPLDAALDQAQTVTVTLEYDQPVESLSATLILNGESFPNELSQVASDGSTSTWEGSWTMPAEYTQSYGLTLSATGADGQTSTPPVELFFR